MSLPTHLETWGLIHDAGTAGLPENLHSWLLEVDSKGYLVRDVKNLMVTLGPNNSFFATDKKSTYWRNLPAPLDKEIIALRNSKNEMTTGFKCVQLGINGNYVMIKEGNGGAWQLSSYPGLNRFLDGVRTANENRGGMFQCIRVSVCFLLHCQILMIG